MHIKVLLRDHERLGRGAALTWPLFGTAYVSAVPGENVHRLAEVRRTRHPRHVVARGPRLAAGPCACRGRGRPSRRRAGASHRRAVPAAAADADGRCGGERCGRAGGACLGLPRSPRRQHRLHSYVLAHALGGRRRMPRLARRVEATLDDLGHLRGARRAAPAAVGRPLVPKHQLPELLTQKALGQDLLLGQRQRIPPCSHACS
mmetsp:Transcript_47913/g.137524  ORF Transcript_47913/g.137524 Transcript_47913/m.137524 type:complete len:204 (+) Transcript_47913:1-612(+)